MGVRATGWVVWAELQGSALGGEGPQAGFRARFQSQIRFTPGGEPLGLEPLSHLDRLAGRFQPSAQRSVLSGQRRGGICHLSAAHDGMCRRGRFLSLCVSRECRGHSGSGRGPKGGSQPVRSLQDTLLSGGGQIHTPTLSCVCAHAHLQMGTLRHGAAQDLLLVCLSERGGPLGAQPSTLGTRTEWGRGPFWLSAASGTPSWGIWLQSVSSQAKKRAHCVLGDGQGGPRGTI